MAEFDPNVESGMMQKQTLIKRLIFTGQLTRFIVYIAAAIPASICMILALLAFEPIGILKPFVSGNFIIGTSIDYIVFAVLIASGTFGIYEFIRLRRVRKIDERFPDFVRDLAESRRAGMTFTKAIMYSAKGNYGSLTTEIQKIARQISWGSSVDAALNSFAKRVNTRLIRRTISLIIEASRSGGNVADVLDAASKDAREIKLIDSERRASMLSYVAVIYVGMGVFLLIIVILTKSLIPSMLGEGAGAMAGATASMSGGGGSGGLSGRITEKAVTEVFFYASVLQCFFMGLVTGVFEEGNIVSGVKHSFIMLIIAWIIFKFMVGGI